MNSTETAKLRVEIEGDEADKTLLSLKTEAKEINKTLREMKDAGEEGSDAWKELKIRQAEVNGEIKEMVKNIDLNDASMNELKASSRLLNRELADLKVGSDAWIDKMKEVQDVDGRIKQVREEVSGLKDDADENTSAWDTFKAAFMGAFTFEAVVEAAGAIIDFGKDVLEITAKFEKYNAILETTLGSHEAGAAAFEMIQEFAAKTNFTVDELTESYIKMANRGLRPGQEELMKMADVANASGHSMGELVEAVNDINNTDRWNEIGVKCVTMGDKVQLSFKGQTETVARTEQGVMDAMVAFGEMEGVMGMTNKISATLEGQLSNLDDNFDRLKTTIGGESTDAFKGMVKVGNELIDAFIEIWTGTAPVRESMGELVDVGSRFGQTLGTLISVLFGYDDKAKATTIITDAITVAFRLIGGTMIAAVGAVQILADGYNALINKGKEVANFFGAEFKIDPKANFDTLAKNFEANGKAIDKIWADGEAKREDTSKKTDAAIVNNAKKSGETVSEDAKKEAEKRAKEHEKAETDSQKKIADMKVKAIADETVRKVAEINLQYDREEAAVRKSVASQTTKNTQLALLATERETKISKAEDEARVKKDKADADVAQKLDALKIKLIADDSQRRIAEMTAQAARDTATINKTVTDEAQKAEALKLINDKLSRDVQAENDKQRDAEAKKNAKLRDDESKATKQLFDNQFKEYVALSDAKLLNAKDNADKIYEAKLDRLKAEYNYNKQKLQQEADEEKRKNDDLIRDTDRRAEANKGIDARLKATLSASDTKYESDKSRLLEENLAKRKANTDQFFSAIDSAMNGDYTKFMGILNKKLSNEQAANQKGLQDFTKKGIDTLALAGQVVGSLQTLNQKYLDSQIAKINKEKATQLASWKSQYESGKINKDEYEAEVAKINAASAEKEKAEKLKAFKRDQALQIAMAVINGAQAALKSLATMGWPLGLIGAAAAAVSAGIQIAMIKRQKPPEFAKGGSGYVKNAGVVKGDRHGNAPGVAGISMVNRRTGEEVGEMEGDEPFMILSRNTYKNNRKTVDMLLHSSLHRNGASIFGDGGTSGDYVGRRPSFGNGGLGGKKWFEEGGVDGGSGSEGVMDWGGVTSSPEVGEASGTTAATTAEISKSQKLMEDIAANTEDTVLALVKMQTFLNGDFLKEIRGNGEDMKMTLKAGLDSLIMNSKQQSDALVGESKAQTGALAGELQKHTGLLGAIAAKDLSVSVQTFVNVFNQISVVADKSNFK